jgi:hypothetical protein
MWAYIELHIQQSEAKKMPYLQVCIHEALRISLPAVGMAAKVVSSEGDTIRGHFVPGGTCCAGLGKFINPMHHVTPMLFGIVQTFGVSTATPIYLVRRPNTSTQIGGCMPPKKRLLS